MTKYLKIFSLIALGIAQIQCATIAHKARRLSTAPTIRVMLVESNSLSLRFNGSYRIESGSPSPRIPRGEKIRFTLKNRKIRMIVRGKAFEIEGPIKLRAGNSRQQFELSGRSYFGNLTLTRVGGNLQAVNSLDLEAYVKGVIPAEMGRRSKSEIEALKAQAVAARTYALKKIQDKKNGSGNFDVMAGISDQAYVGREKVSNWTDQAVDDTDGEVITYKGNVAFSFYHSTCGGRTESAREVFAINGAPYLAGVADDFGKGDFCRLSPHYRWTEEFSFRDLSKSFRRMTSFQPAGSYSIHLSQVKVSGRHPSGRVSRLAVSFSDGNELEVGSIQVRNFFNPSGGGLLRSNLFRILNTASGDNNIILVGAGSGHGVGMCQWGALGMARAGYTYSQILRHYYRGTVVKKLY